MSPELKEQSDLISVDEYLQGQRVLETEDGRPYLDERVAENASQ